MSGLIVHEWAAVSGGSEQVVDQFVKCFPDSDVQVLWDDTAGRFGPRTYETWIARTPIRRSKALSVPFLLPTWRYLPQRADYEWMLVSSHLFAHHARLSHARGVPKYVYAHTPARYLWEPELDPRGGALLARAAAVALKPLDARRAQEARAIAANSKFTAHRIERTWQREAVVIYPPVDVDAVRDVIKGGPSPQVEVTLNDLPGIFVLGASRFVSYKQLDRVISVAEAADVPAVIAGGGPEERRLREIAAAAKVPVYFVIAPASEVLYFLYSHALCFVFPAIEDFGIMPVEAMATGTPVLTASIGGAAESSALTGGGLPIHDFRDAAEIRTAVRSAAQLNREVVSRGADQFAAARFREEIIGWVQAHA